MDGQTKKINIKSIDSFLDFSGPIKHVARLTLWLPAAKDLKGEKNRVLKYFTLPGKLAWDVFLFEKHGIIKKEERGFPDVRFCDNNYQFYTEATKLLGSTIGIKESFEDLVLNDHKIFWDEFPYDLYNLDFCGTCFPDNQPPFSNTFKAIQKIIEKQTEANEFPFVVFLTLKALKDETTASAIDDLKNNIESNRSDPSFTKRIDQIVPDVDKFTDEQFDNFIIISIPKMICLMAKEKCNVEVKARAKYKRSNSKGTFYITKFVFKFTKKEQSPRVKDENYVSNVLNTMRLDNVKEITNRDISKEIKSSLSELMRYIKYLKSH